MPVFSPLPSCHMSHFVTYLILFSSHARGGASRGSSFSVVVRVCVCLVTLLLNNRAFFSFSPKKKKKLCYSVVTLALTCGILDYLYVQRERERGTQTQTQAHTHTHTHISNTHTHTHTHTHTQLVCAGVISLRSMHTHMPKPWSFRPHESQGLGSRPNGFFTFKVLELAEICL